MQMLSTCLWPPHHARNLYKIAVRQESVNVPVAATQGIPVSYWHTSFAGYLRNHCLRR